MKCIYCRGDTIVTDSRLVETHTRRRRKCKQCKRTFSTLETPEKQTDPDGEQTRRLLKAARLYLAHLQAVLKQLDRTAT